MLLDDSQYMRLVLKKSISSTEHQVIAEASNGLEALRMYRQNRPDLVFMDITMPEMNGLDTLKERSKGKSYNVFRNRAADGNCTSDSEWSQGFYC